MNAADTLQAAVNEYLSTADVPRLRITLDHGSDVTDLSKAVDVRVFEESEDSFRLFTILAASTAVDFVRFQPERASDATRDGVFCVGGPLCLVRCVTGRSVVGAVTRYLEYEQARVGQY